MLSSPEGSENEEGTDSPLPSAFSDTTADEADDDEEDSEHGYATSDGEWVPPEEAQAQLAAARQMATATGRVARRGFLI